MARACETAYDIRFCGLRYFNVAGCGPVELEDPAILCPGKICKTVLKLFRVCAQRFKHDPGRAVACVAVGYVTVLNINNRIF